MNRTRGARGSSNQNLTLGLRPAARLGITLGGHRKKTPLAFWICARKFFLKKERAFSFGVLPPSFRQGGEANFLKIVDANCKRKTPHLCGVL
jgi:hypothetical protein